MSHAVCWIQYINIEYNIFVECPASWNIRGVVAHKNAHSVAILAQATFWTLLKLQSIVVSHSPGMSSSVIGISGASGSGKTTLAEHLATRLRDEGVMVEIVHQDSHWQKSSLNKTAEGKRTWEGPQFTDWAWLEWSVIEARQRASVVIVEGYLLLDCSTALFDSLDVLFWVESTKEQCLSRRTSFPRCWRSSMAYAEACVWPVHEEYMHRAAQRMAGPPEKLCNMKAALVFTAACWSGHKH